MENNIIPLIVLCAGASSRMGSPKGLLTWQQRPLLIHQIENFLNLDFLHYQTQVIVVLGNHKQVYLDCLHSNVSPDILQKIQIVTNPAPDRGQFSSISLAISTLAFKTEYCFLLPIDCPFPPTDIWYRLWQARSKDVMAIIPSFKLRSGHPLLLTQSLMQKIIQSPPESRLDHLLQTMQANQKKYVEALDASIFGNINRPEDINT